MMSWNTGQWNCEATNAAVTPEAWAAYQQQNWQQWAQWQQQYAQWQNQYGEKVSFFLALFFIV